ncbi:hypothetical protein ACFLXB_01015 [Chloroflexota bacterium]
MKYLSIFNKPSNALIFIVTSILVFIVCVNQPVDPDMWWHLRNGQLVFTQGEITKVDLFSFTRFGQAWTNAFWLSDLLIYSIFKVGGFAFLVSFFAFLGSLVYMLIFVISPGPFLLRAFLVVIAAISTAPEWTIRPQVISFLLFSSLNFYLLSNPELKWKKFIWLPLLFLFWANMHGGYIWGFLLLAAVIVGNLYEIYISKNEDISKVTLKRFTLIVVISLGFVLINPNDLSILKLPFQTIDVSIASIVEWASPNFHDPIMQPFLWIILLFIASLGLTEDRLSMDQLLKVIGFIFMAFLSQRNIPLAVMVIAPIMIGNFNSFQNKFRIEKQIKSIPPHSIKGAKVINSLIVLLLGFVCILRVQTQISDKYIRENFPEDAVLWIQENKLKGNMLNSYNWGGYLIYNLPDHKVFIDGRADLYGKELISSWWEIVSDGQNSVEILDKYNIDFLLLEPNRPIIGKLLEQGWEIAFKDELSIVIIRESQVH